MKWKCRRCGETVKRFSCGCAVSPSPWEPVSNWLYQPIPCETFFSPDGERFAVMPRYKVWLADAEPFIGPILVFALLAALLALTR